MPQLLDLTAQFVDDYRQLQQKLDGLRIEVTTANNDELNRKLREAEEQLNAARRESDDSRRLIRELEATAESFRQQLQAKDAALKYERDQHAKTKQEAVDLQIQVSDLAARLARHASRPVPTPTPMPAPGPTVTPAALGQLNERIAALTADKNELQEEVRHLKEQLHDCEMALLDKRQK